MKRVISDSDNCHLLPQTNNDNDDNNNNNNNNMLENEVVPPLPAVYNTALPDGAHSHEEIPLPRLVEVDDTVGDVQLHHPLSPIHHPVLLIKSHSVSNLSSSTLSELSDAHGQLEDDDDDDDALIDHLDDRFDTQQNNKFGISMSSSVDEHYMKSFRQSVTATTTEPNPAPMRRSQTPAATLQRLDTHASKEQKEEENNNHDTHDGDYYDDDDDDDYYYDEDDEERHSQNSSRDWGWFEEIHLNGGKENDTASHGHGLALSNLVVYSASTGGRSGEPQQQQRRRRSRRTGKKRGLVPHVHEVQEIINIIENADAAAMAVTAPTYVLEESLSSQKLWKITAGQRPPQPVEERAFYEKMWAQNFARSQVKYDMPVEVLTATSPISLSPFAEHTFDDANPTADSLATYSDIHSSHRPGDDDEAALVASRMLHENNGHSSESNRPSVYLRQQAVHRRVRGYGSDGDLVVLVRGDNVFGTTVSKSFARPSAKGGPIIGVDTVNISIASYRVVESTKYGKYAQFLVIYREGSIRDTLGVWKRYRDFEDLARKVTHVHEGCAAVIANMSPLSVTEEPETEHLPNAVTSWRLLKKRQRWYRCVDAGYLSLKVFLLERFLHDILFESSSPRLLREFVAAKT